MKLLDEQSAEEETNLVRHVRFQKPLITMIDGKSSKGVVVFSK
jgi:hypothetical protein